MATIKASIGKEHYQTVFHSATNTLIADEPTSEHWQTCQMDRS